jgi:hypothetical protein
MWTPHAMNKTDFVHRRARVFSEPQKFSKYKRHTPCTANAPHFALIHQNFKMGPKDDVFGFLGMKDPAALISDEAF